MKKIQITFDAEGVEVLDELKEASGVTHYVDVLKNALGYYYWTLQQQKDGSNVTLNKIGAASTIISLFQKFEEASALERDFTTKDGIVYEPNDKESIVEEYKEAQEPTND